MGISFLDWRGGEGHLVSNILILEGSSQNGEKTKLCGKPYSLHLLLWQLRGKKKKNHTSGTQKSNITIMHTTSILFSKTKYMRDFRST